MVEPLNTELLPSGGAVVVEVHFQHGILAGRAEIPRIVVARHAVHIHIPVGVDGAGVVQRVLQFGGGLGFALAGVATPTGPAVIVAGGEGGLGGFILPSDEPANIGGSTGEADVAIGIAVGEVAPEVVSRQPADLSDAADRAGGVGGRDMAEHPDGARAVLSRQAAGRTVGAAGRTVYRGRGVGGVDVSAAGVMPHQAAGFMPVAAAVGGNGSGGVAEPDDAVAFAHQDAQFLATGRRSGDAGTGHAHPQDATGGGQMTE